MPFNRQFHHEISILPAGEAGQGIQTVEVILTQLLRRAGFHIFATKEYMSRVRGGSNSTPIRVSSEPAASAVRRIDLFIPFDADALKRYQPRTNEQTLTIGDPEHLSLKEGVIDVPLFKIAEEIGNPLYATTAASGLTAGLMNTGKERLSIFTRKSRDWLRIRMQRINCFGLPKKKNIIIGSWKISLSSWLSRGFGSKIRNFIMTPIRNITWKRFVGSEASSIGSRAERLL